MQHLTRHAREEKEEIAFCSSIINAVKRSCRLWNQWMPMHLELHYFLNLFNDNSIEALFMLCYAF